VEEKEVKEGVADGPLPMGWHEGKSDDGVPYYWSDTGGQQWERPKPTDAIAPPSFADMAAAVAKKKEEDALKPLPAGWHESKAEDGNTYYWSDKGERQWERPPSDEEDPEEQLEKVPEIQEFQPSSEWAGSRPGYKFQMGPKGLGYYIDGEKGAEVAKLHAKESGNVAPKVGGKAMSVEESGGEGWCYKDMQDKIQGAP